eukprot:2730122-Pyramimonas_sp.AAC.1
MLTGQTYRKAAFAIGARGGPSTPPLGLKKPVWGTIQPPESPKEALAGLQWSSGMPRDAPRAHLSQSSVCD